MKIADEIIILNKGDDIVLENNYFELLEDIKSTLITTRNKVIENANKDLIIMYYNIFYTI